ncbi:hypothetical protein DRQ09_08885 [candidate division KSB1 bacterium]|nr:MAG: hypothetical protein DRQ09_08885 [candidate division KSB1 bacterium]
MKNFVADQFSNAVDVAKYVVENLNRLEKETKLWHDTFFSSSLPSYVLDAVSSQVSTIRTNTCMLLADGSFFAFEGCGDNAGCCPMNCTHVWNYEQSLAHLFPSLERSMRNTDFLHNIREDNSMAFRTLIPLGPYHWKYKPAADGQMGCVMKAYREWKFSGDTEWLRTIWPGVKKALEYAWTKEKGWDPNKDGVMEGEQHNTYDIEFYGPNTMMGSLYLGALKAASEMARALGETEKANEYLSLYKKGSRIYDSELWNGSYFIQKVKVMPGIEVPERLRTPENIRCACKQPPGGKKVSLEKGEVIPKYQYGEGCLSDQLLGQWFAYVSGLGNLLSPEHTKKAVKSIFDYNWRRHIGDFSNVQRVYALNDDAGLLLCTWPFGKRPKLPFVYSDEVWTGIEYQVAAHLIYEGWLKEGLSIVKGVRDRYDGLRRNPWDEVECGHHYARAMSSWSLLLALSGAHYDGIEKSITFGPRINREDFQCFWSAGSGWGKFKESVQNDNLKSSLIIEYGELNIKQFTLNNLRKLPKNAKVKLNNQELEFEIKTEDKSCTVIFSKILKMQKDDVLIVEF